MELRQGKWYVYAHYVDNRLIYIGKGVNGRGFELNKRTVRWKRIVGARPVTIKIIAWFDTDEEALRFECRQLAMLKPIANGYQSNNIGPALAELINLEPVGVSHRRLGNALAYGKRRAERQAWHEERHQTGA